MKKLFLLFVTIAFMLFNGYAIDDENPVIVQADALIQDHAYKTAFSYLSEHQDELEQSDLVVKQVEILLDYFVLSTMHQMFALIDIPADEEIYDYRGKDGSYEFILYKPDEVIESAIADDPENGELFYWLGRYYYEVLQKYPGSWLQSDDALRQLAIKNYQTALEKEYRNEFLYGTLGELYLQENDYGTAMEYLMAGIEMDDSNPATHHNLSVANYFAGNFDEALNEAVIAIDQYEDDLNRADSNFLAGSILMQMDDLENAVGYFQAGKALAPDQYRFSEHLLYLGLKTNQMDLAAENAVSFFGLYPKNPTVLSNIMNNYYRQDKLEDMEQVCVRLLELYDDNEILGNIYFHKAIVSEGIGKAQQAIEELELARENFAQVFPADHQVFAEIESMLSQIRTE